MGYYCTVPQCTSLAGKTKNVKFHRFPRDETLAHKWNVILHRNKPFTKYSKVCSLHFTQSDYNVTSMGQWKTLSKDAIPTQNLPRLNSDGTVMVIRKSRSLKSKSECSIKKENEDISDRRSDWTLPNSSSSYSSSPVSSTVPPPAAPDMMQGNLSQGSSERHASLLNRTTKNDAVMQTDPLDITSPVDHPPQIQEKADNRESAYAKMSEDFAESYDKRPKNYSKETVQDYSQINQSYITDRNKHYAEKSPPYNKCKHAESQYFNIPIEYPMAKNETFNRTEPTQNFGEGYAKDYFDSAEVLRNQQHNLQLLHEHMNGERMDERFYAGRIKEETNQEEEGFAYDMQKENNYASLLQHQQRLMDLCERRAHIKSEPDTPQNCEPGMQNAQLPLPEYYRNEEPLESEPNVSGGYYSRYPEHQMQPSQQPGAEQLIAKQNALAATFWPNSLRRPFYYSEGPHSQINNSVLHSKYEDMNRLMNP